MLLEISDLHVRYGGIRALRGVSLNVDDGEVVALLGANGAGKTTTLRTISGLIRPSAGTVTMAGRSLASLRAHEIAALGIGHSPEGRRVFPQMSVLENLELGGWRQPNNAARSGLERVWQLFPVLAERRRQSAGTLSGGEQQMLAIGRALMGRPSLLLLDEPSLGLAPMIVQQIFQIVDEINRQGTAVLLVEQNAKQALARSDRAYVLENGEVALDGPSDQVAADPRVRAAYLGAAAGGAPPQARPR